MWYVNKIWVHNSFICIQCRNSGSSSSVQDKKKGRKEAYIGFWLARKCVLRINCRNVSSSFKVTRKLNYLLQQLNLTVNVVLQFFYIPLQLKSWGSFSFGVHLLGFLLGTFCRKASFSHKWLMFQPVD